MDAGKIVPIIVGFLVALGVGSIVLFEVLDSPEALDDEVTETFTGYSHGDNASAWSVDLANSPISSSDTNVTCYSSTAGTLSYPSFTLSNTDISVAAGAASNFTQVNVTYSSNSGAVGEEVRDMGGTVMELLPIVALVLVASIIISIVVTMGSGKNGGF